MIRGVAPGISELSEKCVGGKCETNEGKGGDMTSEQCEVIQVMWRQDRLCENCSRSGKESDLEGKVILRSRHVLWFKPSW